MTENTMTLTGSAHASLASAMVVGRSCDQSSHEGIVP